MKGIKSFVGCFGKDWLTSTSFTGWVLFILTLNFFIHFVKWAIGALIPITETGLWEIFFFKNGCCFLLSLIFFIHGVKWAGTILIYIT